MNWLALILWGGSIAAASVTTDLGNVYQVEKPEWGPNEDFAFEEKDPITNFKIIFPTNGDIETLPLAFRVEIQVTSVESFNSHYRDKILCIQLNKKWKECTSLSKPSVVFSDLPTGNYMVQAFITDQEGVTRYRQTMFTTLTIVTPQEFETYSTTMQAQNEDHPEIKYGKALLEWARQQNPQLERHTGSNNAKINRQGSDVPGHSVNNSTCLLVVGVKTAVVENFAYRQAIRETWASSQALPPDVEVIFLGCTPKLTELSAEEQEQIKKAVDLEKQTYGDLLTDELRCEDSYDDLSNKVKRFLHFASQGFPQTPFVMIANDDIYLHAGRLVDELQVRNRSERLYIGQVWEQLLGHSQAPVRDATERYYISEEHYPLQSYPPFAFGAHYVLSMDCARFIAKNSERLHGLGGMDDVSIAMWLLMMQVHVEPTPAFSSLQLRGCENRHISLSDMTAFGIRSVHSNLVENRSLCFGFDEVNWQKNDNPLNPETSLEHVHRWEIQTYIHDLAKTEYLYVTSIISSQDNAGVKVSYYPSAETFIAYSRRVCLEVFSFVARLLNYKSWMCREITEQLRNQLQNTFQTAESTGEISSAFLELWRHNLFIAEQDAPPYIIAYSAESSYASVVFECIFKTIFESHKWPVLLVPEKALHVNYDNKADIFVFSIFDAYCEPMSTPGCAEMIAYYMHHYLPPPRESNAIHLSKLMMISGEAIDTQALDDRVPLLSSVSGVKRRWHAYLPVASISFSERLQHTPMALLSSANVSEPGERKFCAYLYARCDRPNRETMFDLLNALEPVDALGVCAGSSRLPNKSYKLSRYTKWFNDEAVNTYQRYKFVIAFENSAEPGYVTEKLVNPLLAGSIPIYLGNSTTTSQLFNPASYIDCGRFENLADCAKYVLQVHKSPELYARMRREPPILNITAFNDAFSWHPSVPSRALADNVADMLGL